MVCTKYLDLVTEQGPKEKKKNCETIVTRLFVALTLAGLIWEWMKAKEMRKNEKSS